MSYTKNITSNFFTRVIKIILGFGVSIIVSRALGPKGKGYIQYLLLIFSLISSYGHFGINNATAYFYKKSKYKAEEVYQTNLSYLILIWFIISFVIFFLKKAGIIFVNYSWLFIIEGFIFVFFNFILLLVREIFISDERIIEGNKYFLINNLFVFFSLIILWQFGILTVNLYFIFRILGVVIHSLLYFKNLHYKFKFKFNKLILKKEIRYGLIIYFSVLFIYLNYRVDQFLIKKFLGDVHLGIYSVGVNLAELVFLVPQSITTALNSKLYNLPNNSNHRNNITVLTIKYTIYLSIFLVIIGFLFTPLVPIVYGNDFSDSVPIIKILFFGIIFASIGKVGSGYFLTKGTPKINLFIALFILLLNILLNLFLIPKYGLIGAAISSTISYFVYGISYLLYFIKVENFSAKKLLVINKKDISFIKDKFSLR